MVLGVPILKHFRVPASPVVVSCQYSLVVLVLSSMSLLTVCHMYFLVCQFHPVLDWLSLSDPR